MPARRWFSFKGGLADPSLPGSYIYSPANPTCINGFNLCSIYAVYTTAGPSQITARLQNYIANVLSTGLAQPTGQAVKIFAYGKS